MFVYAGVLVCHLTVHRIRKRKHHKQGSERRNHATIARHQAGTALSPPWPLLAWGVAGAPMRVN